LLLARQLRKRRTTMPPPPPPLPRHAPPAVTPIASRPLIVARSRSRSKAASLSRAIFQSLSKRYSSVVIRNASVVPGGSLIFAIAFRTENQKARLRQPTIFVDCQA